MCCADKLTNEAMTACPCCSGRRQGMAWNLLRMCASVVVPGIVLGFGAYFTQKLFNLQLASDYTVNSKIGSYAFLYPSSACYLCWVCGHWYHEKGKKMRWEDITSLYLS